MLGLAVHQYQCLILKTYFFPKFSWIGVKAWVPIAAPAFPTAAESP